MYRLKRCSEVLLCTVLVYISTASCQLTVSSFIGDDVLLPCVYAQDEPLPAKVSVFWRDKDDNIVLDIRNNAPDTSSDQMFRGRVVSFPELYRAGNFSIVMTDVRLSDNSQYDCHIPAVDFQQTIVLSVSGRRVEASTRRPAGGATMDSVHMTLLLLPLAVFFTSL